MSPERPNRSLDVGLLLIRLVVAVVFLYHGSQKLFGLFGGPGLSGFAGALATLGIPAPQVSAVLAACAEFIGGLVLLIGSGARVAAAFIAVNMLVAVTMVHAGHFDASKGGMEYPLTLGVVLVALIFTGPGRLTLGRALASPHPVTTTGSHPAAA